MFAATNPLPPPFELDMIPSVRAVWPGLTGTFRLAMSGDGDSHIDWSPVTDEIIVSLASHSTSNIKQHEIGHVAAIRAFPKLAEQATEEQHEVAAMLFEHAAAQAGFGDTAEFYFRLWNFCPGGVQRGAAILLDAGRTDAYVGRKVRAALS